MEGVIPALRNCLERVGCDQHSQVVGEASILPPIRSASMSYGNMWRIIDSGMDTGNRRHLLKNRVSWELVFV